MPKKKSLSALQAARLILEQAAATRVFKVRMIETEFRKRMFAKI